MEKSGLPPTHRPAIDTRRGPCSMQEMAWDSAKGGAFCLTPRQLSNWPLGERERRLRARCSTASCRGSTCQCACLLVWSSASANCVAVAACSLGPGSLVSASKPQSRITKTPICPPRRLGGPVAQSPSRPVAQSPRGNFFSASFSWGNTSLAVARWLTPGYRCCHRSAVRCDLCLGGHLTRTSSIAWRLIRT